VTLHPRSASLALLLDPQWRHRVWIGGLVLCLPVLGWPAVLGYRAAFVRHLREDTATVLPVWRGQFWRHVGTGIKAMAVVFGHLAPLYAVLLVLLLSRGWRPDATAGWLAAFFVAFPVFATLSLPVACVLAATGAKACLGPGEVALLLLGYATLVFLIPAGFLEVSRTWRFRSAFAVHRTWPFVWRHLRSYAAAWWHSGCMSLVGHLAVPFSPWGVFWCYLGIVTVFQEILWQAEGTPQRGCMARAIAAQATGWGLGRRRMADVAARPVAVWELGSFAVPLPFSSRSPERTT